jgi:glutamate-1-semialdehyde 2,1-aminomutase
VRIARSLRGYEAIATQGYHGAQTDFGHQPAWYGYPYDNVRLHHRFEFGDVDGMRLAALNASCLMVEVPSLDDEDEIAYFLLECRDTADENGIPLIVDDVVGGFRFALAGTAQRYGVKPDMICLGKAMNATGGVSALIGRRDLVGRLGDGSVFYSTTFGGAPDRCAVANETIRWLRDHRTEVYGDRGHLQSIGRVLKCGLLDRGVPVVGQPERSALAFATDAEWLEFCSQMIDAGVMIHRPQFVTLAHSAADVEMTLVAAEQVMKEWRPA